MCRESLTWSHCRSTSHCHLNSRLCSGPCLLSQHGYILHINHKELGLWGHMNMMTFQLIIQITFQITCEKLSSCVTLKQLMKLEHRCK